MSGIKPILSRFNSVEGAIGSLVCTPDGIVIEVQISERFDKDVISAFISSVALSLKTACETLGLDEFSRYQMDATKGNVLLVNLGKSYFVAILEKEADPVKINVALYQTTNELKKMTMIAQGP